MTILSPLKRHAFLDHLTQKKVDEIKAKDINVEDKIWECRIINKKTFTYKVLAELFDTSVKKVGNIIISKREDQNGFYKKSIKKKSIKKPRGFDSNFNPLLDRA